MTETFILKRRKPEEVLTIQLNMIKKNLEDALVNLENVSISAKTEVAKALLTTELALDFLRRLDEQAG